MAGPYRNHRRGAQGWGKRTLPHPQSNPAQSGPCSPWPGREKKPTPLLPSATPAARQAKRGSQINFSPAKGRNRSLHPLAKGQGSTANRRTPAKESGYPRGLPGVCPGYPSRTPAGRQQDASRTPYAANARRVYIPARTSRRRSNSGTTSSSPISARWRANTASASASLR